MTTPMVSLADWRAQVDKELAGAAFDRLVHTTAEGLAIQPLYIEDAGGAGGANEASPPGQAPYTRGATASPAPFKLCVRAGDPASLREDLEGGAEAVWIEAGRAPEVLAQIDLDRAFVVAEPGDDAAATLTALVEAARQRGAVAGRLRFALALDPIGAIAAGRAPAGSLADGVRGLGALGRLAADTSPEAHGALVSTLPYHAAGADAADELAIALSTGVAYLGALLDAGLEPAAAARQIAMQVAIGRDTFVELAKLRALRLCWHKVLAAAGAPESPLALLHAVSASRTLTQRDPWVNMLRVTTQVFAAVLGGADLVTPAAFDDSVGAPSALGRRVARNTALVLREESYLGRVVDPAGGSYYLEAITDGLAREGWKRFRALEDPGQTGGGGIGAALLSGALQARLDAAWKKRQGAIGKRKEPITGVSEFANLGERKLPRGPAPVQAPAPALRVRRDAEAFEHLRDRADAAPVDVLLLTLGPPSEHRGRAGFATAFFAAGGLVGHESADVRKADIAVLCGSDERYATEAADAARALKAAGCRRVVLAGRPGPLEATLREAGVDGFLFVGADVVATLVDLLGGLS